MAGVGVTRHILSKKHHFTIDYRMKFTCTDETKTKAKPRKFGVQSIICGTIKFGGYVLRDTDYFIFFKNSNLSRLRKAGIV